MPGRGQSPERENRRRGPPLAFSANTSTGNQRVDIVKALATAATLPSPSAEHLGTSPCFLLGAALWLLDYVKDHDLEDKFYPLLPDELDDEIGFVTPTVDDLRHTLDEMLGVIAVFMKRKTSSRQAFRKLWGLVDKETAG